MAEAFVRRFVLEPTAPGPLRGTAFAVKDLIDVAGWPTACGNPSWPATHPAATVHAMVVRQLLGAGARLLGKTRTDELAYSLEGCNVHEGAPLNPAAPLRLTGGSSSGSAAAVAAGDVDFALGTDTAGSVRVPAAWCGVIGFRPTHGRVSAVGLAPLAPDFDTVGWLARSGSLVRRVGAVLFDGDGDLARAAADCPGGSPPPETLEWVHDAALDAQAAAASIANPVLDPVAGSAGEAAAMRRFDDLGANLRAAALDIDWPAAAECLRVLQAAQAWRTHGAWIEAVQPCFGPGVAERFAAARAIDANQVRQAERQRAGIVARLDDLLPPGRLLRLPAVPGPAPRRDAGADERGRLRTQLLRLTSLASLTGRPQITLPLGRVAGAPVGVALLGWGGGDDALLHVAARVFP